MIRNGVKYEEIASKFNISISAVSQIARKHKIRRRARVEDTPPELVYTIKRLSEQGMNARRIAELLKVPYSRVRKIINELNQSR